MDAITPKNHADQAGVDGHSHIVRPAEMEWQKTSFPGCWAKPLLFDAKSGLATMLMKFDPGAVLPDHEHVQIEQTYVISGKLELQTQGAKHELSEGDAVYFDSTAPHCYRRVGAKRTTALVVTTSVERAVRPV